MCTAHNKLHNKPHVGQSTSVPLSSRLRRFDQQSRAALEVFALLFSTRSEQGLKLVLVNALYGSGVVPTQCVSNRLDPFEQRGVEFHAELVGDGDHHHVRSIEGRVVA